MNMPHEIVILGKFGAKRCQERPNITPPIGHSFNHNHLTGVIREILPVFLNRFSFRNTDKQIRTEIICEQPLDNFVQQIFIEHMQMQGNSRIPCNFLARIRIANHRQRPRPFRQAGANVIGEQIRTFITNAV